MRILCYLALLLMLGGCGIPATAWVSGGVSVIGNLAVDYFDLKKDLKEASRCPDGSSWFYKFWHLCSGSVSPDETNKP